MKEPVVCIRDMLLRHPGAICGRRPCYIRDARICEYLRLDDRSHARSLASQVEAFSSVWSLVRLQLHASLKTQAWTKGLRPHVYLEARQSVASSR